MKIEIHNPFAMVLFPAFLMVGIMVNILNFPLIIEYYNVSRDIPTSCLLLVISLMMLLPGIVFFSAAFRWSSNVQSTSLEVEDE